nr:immunoglobulin heavy chain junction region [Macaca mulatta]MOV37788.1 immunoglobulin heavy chain junction region [Macaca mulatta]MOV37797.1 immunoglobulin heavy chain junction region [Macaca mulatta]MOV37831.1 immunoglobulin heavy chain junction region [Macaca mulatta]MOV37933.1 immunoglobulin heavy chain junction region [Macaca mulatta]
CARDLDTRFGQVRTNSLDVW